MTLHVFLKEISLSAMIMRKIYRKVMPAPDIFWIIITAQKTAATVETARAARCISESRIRTRNISRQTYLVSFVNSSPMMVPKPLSSIYACTTQNMSPAKVISSSRRTRGASCGIRSLTALLSKTIYFLLRCYSKYHRYPEDQSGDDASEAAMMLRTSQGAPQVKHVRYPGLYKNAKGSSKKQLRGRCLLSSLPAPGAMHPSRA